MELYVLVHVDCNAGAIEVSVIYRNLVSKSTAVAIRSEYIRLLFSNALD